MRVLHFVNVHGAGIVRLQRYLKSNMNMGVQPVVLCRKPDSGAENGKVGVNEPWIPEMHKIPIECYGVSRQLGYLLPTTYDKIGLKRVFSKYRCDLVHAHSIEGAYYSYGLGLPTLFDDWEYYYEYLDYVTPPKTLRFEPRTIAKALLTNIKRGRVKRVVTEMIRSVPVIVTNEEVEHRYRELGAQSVWCVPNVPLSYEREYAFAVDIKKRNTITTCYIGAMSMDENSVLRNTRGIMELWQKNDIGDLLVLENKNYVPHLEVLRKVRECHFNLLFWKPLPVHRYYLQNKAFLASVVGVPTIISSSLIATIKLLKEYALVVSSHKEIPEVIRDHDPHKEYPLNRAHIWEYYEPNIKKAYHEALC